MLKSHIVDNHKDKKYQCSKCEAASYNSQMALQFHIEKVHEGKKYQCASCGDVFDSVYRLDSHTGYSYSEGFSYLLGQN